MFSPTPLKRTLFFLFFDTFLSLTTLFFAYNLRFNFNIPEAFLDNFLKVFLTITLLKISVMASFKIYSVSWRFFSLIEAKKLLFAHFLTYGLFSIVYFLFEDTFLPFARSIIIIDFFISFLMIGSLRILKRLVLENTTNQSLKKAVIVGAGAFSQTFLKSQKEYYVEAILDDDKMVIDTYLSNIKVKSLDELTTICKNQNIKSVIIAKEYDQEKLNELFKILRKQNINDIKIVSFQDKERSLKSLSVEDLLARRPKDLDDKAIEGFIKNKKVLVTGAGGSIGSEICRQCLKYGARELLMLDNNEYNLYKINESLQALHVKPIMVSVTEKGTIEKIFEKYKPQIVIHAAAYKHVPLCEYNPYSAIQNNILGTKNIIDSALKSKVEKIVLISTDKAVRPTNIMGATKRVCELYAQNVKTNDTEIVAVRFGNVLGSSGSVIPKFKELIEANKSLTVTHPDITRYFMLIPEACQLVLQAAAMAKGKELFVLDMGNPVKIVELAHRMLQLYNKEELGINFIGLRPGEKLYEELLIDENDKQTKYESIFVSNQTTCDIDKLNFDIEKLLNSTDPIKELKNIVPEFNHQLND